MFELGSSIKIKCSSLVWAWDKPKNNVWTWACENVKKFELGLAWLISQAKLELNIKLKLELKSSFLAWDQKNCIIKCLYHQKSSKTNIHTYIHIYIYIYIYNILILSCFYHPWLELFTLQLYIIKSTHHHLLSIAWVTIQNTIFTSIFVIRITIIFTNLNKLRFQNIDE